ncbi:glycosyltransferase family 39 protein [soil metagenome]
MVYCAVALAVRLLLSSNIEADESMFVGHTYWAWGYGDSQPPLYNWIVILLLGAFHYWPAIALVKWGSIAAAGMSIYHATRRASGSAVSGMVAALSLALVHQIIWLSQATLSHSVLALAAAAATLYALIRVLERGSTSDFLWLAVAVTAGLLSKYNFGVFVLSLAIAAATIREFRLALWRPQLALTVSLVALAVMPHAFWAAEHPAETTGRLKKLHVQTFVLGYQVPLGGIAGVASLLWAAVANVAPMTLIRTAVQRLAQRHDSNVAVLGTAAAIRKLCIRAVIIAFSLSAIVVLGSGIKNVPERYLTLLLIPFPVWLALSFPLHPRAALLYARCAAAVAVFCSIALTGRMLIATNEYTFPYRKIASDVTAIATPPFAIFGKWIEQRANLVIRIPGTTMFDAAHPAERVLAIWSPSEGARSSFIEQKLGGEYERAGPARLLEHSYAYFAGRQGRMYVQLWRRADSARPAAPRLATEGDIQARADTRHEGEPPCLSGSSR